MKRLLLVIILLATLINGHADERGLPFMSFYPAKETGGHLQNWEIIQDKRGIMYIGNGYGVQEFDGSSWRLITSPNKSLACSFDLDENGRIYVGYSGDFGYLEADVRGTMKFVSLLEYVKPEERSFNYVRSVHVTPSGIYFQAVERIFRFRPVPHADKNQKWQVKTWKTQNIFARAFWIEKYYAFQYGIGLMVMENDSLVLAPGGDYFSQDRVNVMLPFLKMPGNYLIMTRDRGLFVWDGLHAKPFKTDAELIRSVLPYCGDVLPDGNFAIGTLTGGFFIIDENGKTILHLDQSTGLSSNTVAAVFFDKQKNIWLGVDGAVTTLEYNSPLSRFPMPLGNGVNDIQRYKGILYLSTNEGNFYLDPDKSMILPITGDFIQNQSLGMFFVNNELFTASGGGIIRIHDKTGTQDLVSSPLFSFVNKMQTCHLDSAFCFAAQVDGVSLFRYRADKNPRFSFYKKIPGIHEYIVSLLEFEPGTVWCSTSNTGIIRFTYTKNFDVKIERFNEKEGLPAGGVLLFKLPDRLVAATKEGPFKYEKTTNRFVRDSLFIDVEWGISSDEVAIVTDHLGNIWASLGKETVFFAKQPDGSFQLQKFKVARFAKDPAICIFPEKNGTVWFGTSSDVICYSPGETPGKNPPVSALIRRVIIGRDSVAFDGAEIAGETSLKPYFSYRFNNLRFEFALPSYIATYENQFQTKLEGFDTDWSNWNLESKRTYTNLPAGSYRFLVNARNINGQEAVPATFSFNIRPPWYASWWTYTIYALIFILIIIGGWTIQKRRLIQKHQFEAEIQRKTEELERARKLQVSMLPKQMPDMDEYDIAAYMRTATEVGGDYYDFTVTKEGALIAIVGDATGHGIDAGMVVTTMKGLFHFADIADTDIIPFLHHSNKVIKNIYSGKLFMGFQLLKILNRKMILATAGMPPAYLYRSKNNQVEEILIKAMPLGAFPGFPYQQTELALDQGDTLLMASDGLAELFNEEKEIFGYDEVKNVFGKNAYKSSQEIIDSLVNAGDDWRRDAPNDDDITFVVVKLK